MLFGLIGVVRAVRYKVPDYSDNTIVFMLFIFALGIWTDRVRKRIAEENAVRYITAVSVLILFLMTVRTVKFVFLPEGHSMARLAWYAYYIPMTFIPLFLFFSVLYVGRPYGWKIKRKWKLLYIPAGIVSLLFATNDFHEKAFYFPQGIAAWDVAPYQYGWVYFTELVWIAVLSATVLAITFIRCAISEYRVNIWMPLLPLAVGIFYTCCYLFAPGAYILRLYKFAEMVSFVFPAFLEGLIQAHFFPSNDSYEHLWRVSDLKCGIMDKKGKIVFQSEKGISATLSEVVLAQKQEVFSENENLLLRSHQIAGGYSFWFKDITEINRINKELSETGDIIAEENSMLEAENELAENKSRLAEKDRLYNRISEDVEKQLCELSRMLEEPPREEKAFEQMMKQAAILQVYVKRRSNLLLLASEKKEIPVMELFLSLKESLSYVELSGRKAYVEYEGDSSALLEADRVLFIYRLFEDALEEALPDLKAVMLKLSWKEETMVFTMEEAAPRGVLQGDYQAEQLKKMGALLTTETEYEEGEYKSIVHMQTVYLHLYMPKGGDSL